MNFPLVVRGGRYSRVADPAWEDPLDTAHSRSIGGRWNAPGTFGALYLNRDERTARANCARLLRGMPYGPEDLDPDAAPALVELRVPDDDHVDAVSDEGLDQLGLPVDYPLDRAGEPVGWDSCRPIGHAVWRAGLPGIAYRSAALDPPERGEELVWIDRQGRERPSVTATRAFDEWWW